MVIADVEMAKERGGIEIELFNPNRARIKSTWPVCLPRGKTSIATTLLGKALEEGLEVNCDTRRTGFFEAEIDEAWFYFHIAPKLGRIYVVSALIR